MHHIQINNRFADLEFDDENEENVESKKIVEKKEKDVKKETKKPPKSKGSLVFFSLTFIDTCFVWSYDWLLGWIS